SDFRNGRGRRTAEDIADPHNQLPGAEGLGDVPVSTQIKSVDAVHFLAAGRKEDDRRLGKPFVLADLTAEIKAADAGKHDVQQEQRWLHRLRGSHDRRAGEKSRDAVAGVAQIVLDQARDIGVVLYDKDHAVVAYVVRCLQIHRGGIASATGSHKPRW